MYCLVIKLHLIVHTVCWGFEQAVRDYLFDNKEINQSEADTFKFKTLENGQILDQIREG